MVAKVMAGTIRARAVGGDVVFNIRTGKVCKGDYLNIAAIDKLDVETTAKNVGLTVDQLREQGCQLVHCEFSLKSGGVHRAVPYPYKRRAK